MDEFDNRAHNRQTENKDFERVPVSGMRDIMTVLNKEEGYEYRWINDTDEKGSRIYKFKRGGWELAPLQTSAGEVTVGEEAVYRSEGKDDIVRLHVGAGQFAYLMRIKQEWYDADQAAKQAEIDEVEATIAGTGSSTGQDFGQYGSIKIGKHRQGIEAYEHGEFYITTGEECYGEY